MSMSEESFSALSNHLSSVMNSDPGEAVRLARQISVEHPNMKHLRAATLVDAGALAHQHDALLEGLDLLKELHTSFPASQITYNLANALNAVAESSHSGACWIDCMEAVKAERKEARQHLWRVANDLDAPADLRTQAWTNLGNQFSKSFRLSEAHDAWLAALALDRTNGVAAYRAAQNLEWLFKLGICSERSYVEAAMLAKIALACKDTIIEYAGKQAADEIEKFAMQLPEPPERTPHTSSFVSWVERERLALSQTVELVGASQEELDWLTLPPILETGCDSPLMPPPVFAMFNSLKSDFILARDLAWRSRASDFWPVTGQFAETLDYASYGPDMSALALAHRTALDLLDKVAVVANHHFKLGQDPEKIYFGRLWRDVKKKDIAQYPIRSTVATTINNGVAALYGLVELADDYESEVGILRPHKNLRNASTHRFVVLHDAQTITAREALEVEHHQLDQFKRDVLDALRVARSAIQMLALSITQHEHFLRLQPHDGSIRMTFDVADIPRRS